MANPVPRETEAALRSAVGGGVSGAEFQELRELTRKSEAIAQRAASNVALGLVSVTASAQGVDRQRMLACK